VPSRGMKGWFRVTVPNEGSKSRPRRRSLPRINADLPKLTSGRVLERITDELDAGGVPTGFLPAADTTLVAAGDDYLGKLGVEAVRIARRRNATAVDRQDVLDADVVLRGSIAVEKRGWLLSLAGLTGGGAIGALASFLLASRPLPHADSWVAAIIVLALLSVVLFYISYPIQRDRSRVSNRK
jgi:hypothetical protein